MMTSLQPVYVKHSALGANRNDSQLAYRLCMAVSAVVPGHVLGARQVRGLWEIQVTTSVARDKLLSKGFIFKEREILVHNKDPFTTQNIPSEKITIRGIPFGCSDSYVMKYLRDQPQLIIRSNVVAGKIRNGNNELTDFLNGDRYVYVEQGFSPVLDQQAMIDGHMCRVWHPNQALKCTRCSQHGHRTTESDKCPAYIDEPEEVDIFWLSNNTFSNFYMCNINIFDLDFKSAEHCYQYCKLRYIGQNELAQDVLLCDTPRQAKNIAANIPDHLLIQWHEQKLEVMHRILVAKAQCCDKFKQDLIKSDSKILLEGTIDKFWGIGMPGFFAKNTHPDYLCGQNHLGRILMDIRKTLLNNPINNPQTPPPAVCLESATSGAEMEHSDSLSTAVVLATSNQTGEKDSNIPEQSTSATDQNNSVTEQSHDSEVATCSGVNQHDSKQQDTSDAETEEIVPIETSETVADEVCDTASIPELTEESTSAVTSTPVTVRRRRGKRQPREPSHVGGPMDSFLQKLKRKLTPEKASDTVPGDLKQSRSDKPDS